LNLCNFIWRFFNNLTFSNLSGLTSCNQLKSIDLSYNSFDLNLIKLLFSECLKLEEAFLINNVGDDHSNLGHDLNWRDVISFKFDEQVTITPLRRLELKLNFQNEKYEIKSFFKKKWNKSSLKIKQYSKNVIEILVI
jgi:hypothetical protein